MKRLKLIRLSSLLALLALPTTIALALVYVIGFTVTSTGSYNVTPIIVTVNNTYLSSGGFIATSGNDTRVLLGDTVLPHMLTDDKVLFATSLNATTTSFQYITGQPALASFAIITGRNGHITTSDNTSMEPDNSFEIGMDAYLDTSYSGTDKYIVNKPNALNIRVSAANTITATANSTSAGLTSLSLGGITPGRYITYLYLNGAGNLALQVGASNTNAAFADNVTDVTTNWTWMADNSVPYAYVIEFWKAGIVTMLYQPYKIILGTRLPDRTAGDPTVVINATSDGTLDSGWDGVYANVWGAANANAVTNDATFGLGQYGIPPPIAWQYFIERSGISFPTVSVPASAVVTSANITVWGNNDESVTDFDVVVVSGDDLTNVMNLADYGELQLRTVSLGSINTSTYVLGGWNTINLNATGIVALQNAITTGAGNIRFGFRSSSDIAGVAPTTDEMVWFDGVAGGGGNIPYLTISYEDPAIANDGVFTFGSNPAGVTPSALSLEPISQGLSINAANWAANQPEPPDVLPPWNPNFGGMPAAPTNPLTPLVHEFFAFSWSLPDNMAWFFLAMIAVLGTFILMTTMFEHLGWAGVVACSLMLLFATTGIFPKGMIVVAGIGLIASIVAEVRA